MTMPEMTESADKVGSVSIHRYEQIVAELRNIVEAQSRGQFMVGDYALEIEPARAYGAQERGEECSRSRPRCSVWPRTSAWPTPR